MWRLRLFSANRRRQSISREPQEVRVADAREVSRGEGGSGMGISAAATQSVACRHTPVRFETPANRRIMKSSEIS